MTAFHANRYDRVVRGAIIQATKDSSYDFARLERAVRALAESRRQAVRENAALREELEEKNGRIRTLEDQLLEGNQRRQDVVKRIDDLIAQMDQLDQQLGALEEGGG